MNLLLLTICLEISGQSFDYQKRIKELVNIAQNHDPDSAYKLAGDLLVKAKEDNDGYGIVQSIFVKAWIHAHFTYHYDSAMIYYLQAIEEAKFYDFESKNSTLISMYKNCGIISRKFKAYDLAEFYYLEAFRLAKSDQDSIQLMNVSFNLSKLYRQIQRYEEAKEFIQINSQADPESAIKNRFYNQMGLILTELGNYGEARSYLRALLNSPKNHFKAFSRENIGFAHYYEGNLDSATFFFGRALDYYHQSDSNILLPEENYLPLLQVSGECAIKMGRVNLASEIIKEGLQFIQWYNTEIERYTPRSDIFKFYGFASAFYEDLGDLSTSEHYRLEYQKALEKYTLFVKKYDINQIVENFYDDLEQQKQEEERDRKLKLYASVASGGFLVVLFLTFGVNRYQRYRTQKKLARTTTEKRLAELKALKAQINPHFLFNALNSIQSYILEDQHQVAEEYLVKYGQLMRKILDHSNELTVPLNEELEALQLYVELEQLRVNNSFEYKVTVDEAIDPYNTLVPSMVIQPFIENAIWHGVSQLTDRKGLIELTITEKDKLLEVRVKDNGVGYDASQPSSTSSKGVNLVRERLELLKETGGEDSVLEVSSSPGEGTEVVLRFSMELE